MILEFVFITRGMYVRTKACVGRRYNNIGLSYLCYVRMHGGLTAFERQCEAVESAFS